MGIPAWLWFVIAVVAALAGAYLLLRDRAGKHQTDRERQRWANLRGWQYVEEDPQLVERWYGGAIAYFGGQYAVDVVAGSTFTSDGRRPVFVFDLETEGAVDVAVAAVRCRRESPALVELWLPTVPFQRDQMPDLLGPVGQRYAFVSDVNTARAMITRDLVDAVDEIGDDVTVVWLEADWVLAAIAPESSPARLERLLRDLGEVADLIDPFDGQQEPGRHAGYQQQPTAYTGPASGPQPIQPQTPPGGQPAPGAQTPPGGQPAPGGPAAIGPSSSGAQFVAGAQFGAGGQAATGGGPTGTTASDRPQTPPGGYPAPPQRSPEESAEPKSAAPHTAFSRQDAPWRRAMSSQDSEPRAQDTTPPVSPAHGTPEKPARDYTPDPADEYDEYDEEIAEVEPVHEVEDEIPEAPSPRTADDDAQDAGETNDAKQNRAENGAGRG